MQKKGISTIVLAAVMILTFIPPSTFAGNIVDTTFSYNVSLSNKYAYTNPRAKENATSTYVKINQAPGNLIFLDVQGSTSKTNWVNRTVGVTPLARPGEWRVKQLVYEKGDSFARLKFERYNESGTVSGVWSPDSVGNAPHLN
ncbi:DUF2712 domain-containing protein [Bacillus niameyensis]|uniref:DUF2712 domain-containing protein n=1 Tax=Bacillus niameyensis TaxID=1522308 RepID=UPI000785FDAA|nr:DUF2712 domain-containing protein [Bacillus niameyensis]